MRKYGIAFCLGFVSTVAGFAQNREPLPLPSMNEMPGVVVSKPQSDIRPVATMTMEPIDNHLITPRINPTLAPVVAPYPCNTGTCNTPEGKCASPAGDCCSGKGDCLDRFKEWLCYRGANAAGQHCVPTPYAPPVRYWFNCDSKPWGTYPTGGCALPLGIGNCPTGNCSNGALPGDAGKITPAGYTPAGNPPAGGSSVANNKTSVSEKRDVNATTTKSQANPTNPTGPIDVNKPVEAVLPGFRRTPINAPATPASLQKYDEKQQNDVPSPYGKLRVYPAPVK